MYDISLVGRAIDQDFCDRLSEVEGVESFANSYEISLAQIEEKNFYFNTLYGIDDESFFDYMGAEIGDEAYEALGSLNDGRNIVLTELIASKVGVKVGDTISIKVGAKSYDYTVTGLVDSSFKLGNIGFISAANLSSDYEVTYYTNTYVKVADGATATQVRNNIKAEFLEELISIQTLDELIEINSDLIVSIFRIINAYAILALIIGIIGMVNNVSKSFALGKASVPVLKNINLTISDGDFVSIMGPSGSGKSTLLYLMGGLDNVSEGNIVINGKEICKLSDELQSKMRRKEIGFIFQFYNLIPNLTVEENIMLPALLDGADKKQLKKKVDELLTLVGLQERRKHTPRELSGGQQQRTAIARALVTNPDIIFADEPIGNLDSKSGVEVLKLLQKINRESGKTIVMVTHSEESTQYGNRVIRLKDGHVVEQANG